MKGGGAVIWPMGAAWFPAEGIKLADDCYIIESTRTRFCVRVVLGAFGCTVVFNMGAWAHLTQEERCEWMARDFGRARARLLAHKKKFRIG